MTSKPGYFLYRSRRTDNSKWMHRHSNEFLMSSLDIVRRINFKCPGFQPLTQISQYQRWTLNLAHMLSWLGLLSVKTNLGYLLLLWWNWNSLATQFIHPSLVLCKPLMPVWASGESHKINVCRDLATHHSLGTHSSSPCLSQRERAQAEPEASVSSTLAELTARGQWEEADSYVTFS